MKVLWAAVLLTVPFFFAQASAAQAESGVDTAKELANSCAIAGAISDGTADYKYPGSDVVQNSMSAAYCIGYIKGIVGGHSFALRGNKKDFCLPSDVSTDQIARVLARRMELLPEFEHLSQLAFTTAVLTGTWPCTKS